MIDRRMVLAASIAATAFRASASAVDGAAGGAAADAPAGGAGDDWPPANGMPIWPGPPPGARSPAPISDYRRLGSAANPDGQLRGIAVPTLYPFHPPEPNGAALLVLPGGGYEFLAVTREGLRIADRFVGSGYTVYVLAYRLPGEGWDDRADVPLQDAQRAMRLIRSRAALDRIDPGRIGVMGFSAGGHLAATLATASDEQVYAPVDRIDALSARPNYAALLYAVTTLREPDTHAGSRSHLLGPEPSAAAVDRRTPLLAITSATPPTFLVHALDDPIVPPRNGIAWLDACYAAHVPVEAYFPQHGGHGFGVSLPSSNPASLWPDLFTRWQAALTRR